MCAPEQIVYLGLKVKEIPLPSSTTVVLCHYTHAFWLQSSGSDTISYKWTNPVSSTVRAQCVVEAPCVEHWCTWLILIARSRMLPLYRHQYIFYYISVNITVTRIDDSNWREVFPPKCETKSCNWSMWREGARADFMWGGHIRLYSQL